MNRYEFKAVVETLKIPYTFSTTNVNDIINEMLYRFYDVDLYFSGSYYAVIRGKIPLEVVNVIYQKYPDNPYGIRIGGTDYNSMPIDYAVDDQYKQELNECLEHFGSADKYFDDCKKIKDKLLKRKDSKKYIENYSIDKKEGLLIFLIEMKNYYNRKNKINIKDTKKIDDLMLDMRILLSKKYKSTLSGYEWLLNYYIYSETIYNSIRKYNRNALCKMITKAINDFDRVINPYINDEIELDDICNYLYRVEVNSNFSYYKDGRYGEKYGQLQIIDKTTGNKTSYYKTLNGYSYQLYYNISSEEYLVLEHYFGKERKNKKDNGEGIYIVYYNKSNNEKREIRVNISDLLFRANDKKKSDIPIEQLGYIYDELVKGIEYAMTITINNMKKQENGKKKILKKKIKYTMC